MIGHEFASQLPNLLLILTIFTIGVASPGPATLMIMSTAMSRGRKEAIALSFGVVSGSFFWGCLAAFGFVAVMKASAGLFTAMKIAGGLYLLYLASRSLRSALTTDQELQALPAAKLGLRQNFLRGLLLHLTNPKAPLVWIATLSVGLADAAPSSFLLLAVGLCAVVGILVFVGYAFLFSTGPASRFYIQFRRQFNAIVGLFFGAAAIKLISVRVD